MAIATATKETVMTNVSTPSTQSRYVILASMAFDATGEQALREAARIAELHPNSELHVVHVVLEDGPAGSTRELVALDHRLERAPAEMERRIEQVWAEVPRTVIAHIRAGAPSRSILQTAVDIDADLIVVGTHQRRGMEKLMLGSVAEQVLRHAHCPVLVAMPKDYTGKGHSDSIQPPCAKCVETRTQSLGKQYWCDQHSHTHAKPHVYEPSDHKRSSMMPTY
jgi:nucleotide-binding universal stress UspA family protein